MQKSFQDFFLLIAISQPIQLIFFLNQIMFDQIFGDQIIFRNNFFWTGFFCLDQISSETNFFGGTKIFPDQMFFELIFFVIILYFHSQFAKLTQFDLSLAQLRPSLFLFCYSILKLLQRIILLDV